MNGLFLLTFLGTMALSLWAAAKVKIAYAKGSQVPASSGFTGAEAASRILDAAGIRNVQIVEQDGLLGDHYDPMHRRLVLSTQNFTATPLPPSASQPMSAGTPFNIKSPTPPCSGAWPR